MTHSFPTVNSHFKRSLNSQKYQIYGVVEDFLGNVNRFKKMSYQLNNFCIWSC